MQIGNMANAPAAAAATAAANPRLARSAHEFEASLMSELLKPMQQKGGFAGEDDADGAAGSGDALTGFASESLARAISEHGGFGIATRVLKQLQSHGVPKGNGQI